MEALGRLGFECSLVLTETTRRGYEGEALIDASGDFRRLYGAHGGFLYLIRPDGYVELFQRPAGEQALQTYVARLFEAEAVDAAFGLAFGARETRMPVEVER